MVLEIPYITDTSALFSKIAHKPWSVFLDSCHHAYSSKSRFDIIATDPTITLKTQNGITTVTSKQGITTTKDIPFDLIKKYLATTKIPTSIPELPFIGGAIGYWSYDLARTLEKIPNIASDDCQLPEMAIGIYDSVVVVDHQKKQSFFISTDPDQTYEKLFNNTIDDLLPFKLRGTFQSNMSRDYYASAFQKIKDHIYAGDCYQVNLAQRFSALFSGSTWDAYCKLREKNPAPYASYMNFPFTSIMSLSPERFLSYIDQQVQTHPIKGTRPRFPNDKELDKKMQQELLASAKDRAENLMIVDLMRNDLGKTCAYGSIKVPKLFSLETFANVHHLVSTITGKLASNKTSIDLLKTCFPGGSITGAPKIRVMEIIEALEPHRRAIYCGSLGYISKHGTMDTNIAIRTLYTHNNKIYCASGGGIVADSEAESEYQETLNKIRVMLKALES